MTRGRHSARAALLLAAAGCQPVFYDLIGGVGSDGTGSTGHGHTTMSEPTTGASATDPTGPGSGSGGPTDPCSDMGGGMKCGGPGCLPCPPGAPCKDPKECETQLCVDGLCAAPECDAPGDCPQETCRMGTCNPTTHQCEVTVLDAVPCDSGNPCIEGEMCQTGECVGTPRDCSQFDDLCRAGFCNPDTGNCAVEFMNEGESCDDGDSCTSFDMCQQGLCAGDPFAAVFSEDFAAPQGWILGELWQIGQAKPSQCAEFGGEDPAQDHSPGPDNALAGAVIGGCLPDQALAMDACLTSPPIDVNMPGPLFLTYYSRLTTAASPASARVEVWNGVQWMPGWDSKGDAVDEASWTERIVDVSFFKNKGMRVRFCHHLPTPGLPIVAGWSVDDVRIGTPMCPP